MSVKPTMTPQPKEQSHSPLPWHVQPIGGDRYIESSGVMCVADMLRIHCKNEREVAVCDADAELIVEAVNSHARLLAQNEMLRKALKAVLACDDYCAGGNSKVTQEFVQVLNQCGRAMRLTEQTRAALEQTEKV